MQKEQILKIFCKYVKDNKVIPPLHKFLKESKISERRVRFHFDDYAQLKKEARDFQPDLFVHIIDDSIFNIKRYETLIETVKKYKKYFITTYVAGQEIDKKFYESIKLYCKKNDACFLILISDQMYNEIDSFIINDNIVFDEIFLNDNLWISTIKIKAKQIKPLTGIARICQKNGSTILAAPKQYLEFIPVSKSKYPHALMTPGALTKPKYEGKTYIQKRTDYIAQYDHMMGGIIIEIQDEKTFHFRQVQSDEEGCFYDWNNKYTPKKIIKTKPYSFVMGDLHSMQKNQEVFNIWCSIIKELKPKELILHDVFDALSISHHNINRHLHNTYLAYNKLLNLESEIVKLVEDLKILSDLVKQVIIVKSNHDEHLEKYLDEGRFMQDYENAMFAYRLAGEFLKKGDVLKYACEIKGLVANNIKWLRRDEDYFFKNIQYGVHGDKGAHGGKASVDSLERAFGKCIIGHSHFPQIYRGVWKVGTTSELDLNYNDGLSSWCHTSALTHDNGSRQLINIFNGSWKV